MDELVDIMLEGVVPVEVLDLFERVKLSESVSPSTKRSFALLEVLSTSDWAKFATMFALMWQKLDRLITHASKENDFSRQQVNLLNTISNEIKRQSK